MCRADPDLHHQQNLYPSATIYWRGHSIDKHGHVPSKRRCLPVQYPQRPAGCHRRIWIRTSRTGHHSLRRRYHRPFGSKLLTHRPTKLSTQTLEHVPHWLNRWDRCTGHRRRDVHPSLRVRRLNRMCLRCPRPQDHRRAGPIYLRHRHIGKLELCLCPVTLSGPPRRRLVTRL